MWKQPTSCSRLAQIQERLRNVVPSDASAERVFSHLQLIHSRERNQNLSQEVVSAECIIRGQGKKRQRTAESDSESEVEEEHRNNLIWNHDDSIPLPVVEEALRLMYLKSLWDAADPTLHRFEYFGTLRQEVSLEIKVKNSDGRISITTADGKQHVLSDPAVVEFSLVPRM